MSAWNDMVKKHAKANPGKSLKEILPLAKMEYRKTHKVGVHKKKGTHRVHKNKGTRGAHKKKRQRGGSECGSYSSDSSVSGVTNNVVSSGSDSAVTGADGGVEAYNSDDQLYLDNKLGGKHRHKKRGSKRKGKSRRKRKGKRSMKKHR